MGYVIENLKLTNFWENIDSLLDHFKKSGQNRLVNAINKFITKEVYIDNEDWLKLVELVLINYVNIEFVSEVFDYSIEEKNKIIESIKNSKNKQAIIEKIFFSNKGLSSENGLVFGEVFEVETENETETETENIEEIWLDWYRENHNDEFDIDWDIIEIPKIKANTKKYIEVYEQQYLLEEKIEKQKDIYSDNWKPIPKNVLISMEKKLKVLDSKLLIYGKKLDRLQFEFYLRSILECSFLDFNDSDLKIDPRIPYKK